VQDLDSLETPAIKGLLYARICSAASVLKYYTIAADRKSQPGELDVANTFE